MRHAFIERLSTGSRVPGDAPADVMRTAIAVGLDTIVGIVKLCCSSVDNSVPAQGSERARLPISRWCICTRNHRSDIPGACFHSDPRCPACAYTSTGSSVPSTWPSSLAISADSEVAGASFERISSLISTVTSVCSARNCLAFSRPWPSCSPL